MFLSYPTSFVFAFVASMACTAFVRKLAIRFRVFDVPSSERKIHEKPIPLMGGLAVFFSFFATVFLFSPLFIGDGYIKGKHLLGIFIASLCIIVGGIIDDKWNLSWKKQLLFAFLAIFTLIAFGIGIQYVTNPLGGVIRLDIWQIIFLKWNSVPYKFTILADLFTVFWLLLMMESTKLLDGLDGLVSGISVIAGLLLFAVSLRKDLLQYDTAFLALALAGAFAGFLIWNFHPAKIFLGEGGAMLSGFLIGTLAVIAGGKIFTALLVMGIPLLDMLWVIVRRVFYEKRSPFRFGDRKHLHFRLLDAGLSHRQAVLLYYALSFGFGVSILFLQGSQKVAALFLLLVTMCTLACILVFRMRKAQQSKGG